MTCPKCDHAQALRHDSTKQNDTQTNPTDQSKPFRVAVAGNPNAGKSTIFNALTGARQEVGNWPGKTVEKREGHLTIDSHDFEIVDLPGTYSLTPFSAEETIALDFLLDENPDVVVVVVDASNLERNLYLTIQIVEMGLPVIVALNMMDMVEARGISIDLDRLSHGLGQVHLVPTVARLARGTNELKDCILKLAMTHNQQAFKVDYGADIEAGITRLENLITGRNPRWLAIKLLENDPGIAARLADQAEALHLAQEEIGQLESISGEEADILITDRRYGYINGLVHQVVKRPGIDRFTLSDKIDRVLTHPVVGIPVFIAVMWFVFQMTANISAYYLDWIDGVFGGPVTRWALAVLNLLGLGGTWVESMVVDGVIAGVGGVLVFIPVLMFMYFFIAMLEDSGYIARAALLMDRSMRFIGLHGKSFIPMLLGFGCTVPAIYATRTLDNPRDRLLTGLLVPFMSCGARLPVYVVIGTAFFGVNAGTLVFAMYMLGIVIAILVGLALKRTLLRTEEDSPFVIELPPYRAPSIKGVLIHTWERTYDFIRNATTIILLVSICIWLLMAIPADAPPEAHFAQVDTEHSALAVVGGAIAPALKPAGFGTWEASSALITGFVAKEIVVSTLSQVYVGGEIEEATEPTTFLQDLGEIGLSFLKATWDTIRATISLIPGVNLFGEAEEEAVDPALAVALRGAFTPLSAVAYCVFVLLTVPCMATITTLRQEFGGKWTAFSIGLAMAVSWTAAVLVYQGGLLLGIA